MSLSEPAGVPSPGGAPADRRGVPRAAAGGGLRAEQARAWGSCGEGGALPGARSNGEAGALGLQAAGRI